MYLLPHQIEDIKSVKLQGEKSFEKRIVDLHLGDQTVNTGNGLPSYHYLNRPLLSPPLNLLHPSTRPDIPERVWPIGWHYGRDGIENTFSTQKQIDDYRYNLQKYNTAEYKSELIHDEKELKDRHLAVYEDPFVNGESMRGIYEANRRPHMNLIPPPLPEYNNNAVGIPSNEEPYPYDSNYVMPPPYVVYPKDEFTYPENPYPMYEVLNRDARYPTKIPSSGKGNNKKSNKETFTFDLSSKKNNRNRIEGFKLNLMNEYATMQRNDVNCGYDPRNKIPTNYTNTMEALYKPGGEFVEREWYQNVDLGDENKKYNTGNYSSTKILIGSFIVALGLYMFYNYRKKKRFLY